MTILRTPLSDRKAAITGTDKNFLYGLAGFWVFGGGTFTGISATHHDAYDEIPHAPELSYDLGIRSAALLLRRPLRLVPLRAVGLP